MTDVNAAAPPPAPASAAAVANTFLELGWAETQPVPPIDQMKLQKLLFYAHAWHLGNSGRPLFEQDFEAWPWGPVVRDVYFETRDYGRSPITAKVTEFARVGDGIFGFKVTAPTVEDPALLEYLRNVWQVYKGFNGVQLSNSTHGHGEPWTIIKEQYGSLDHKPTIPNELIRAVYEQKVRDAATAHNPPAN